MKDNLLMKDILTVMFASLCVTLIVFIIKLLEKLSPNFYFSLVFAIFFVYILIVLFERYSEDEQ